VIISTQMTVDGVIDPMEWFIPGGGHNRSGLDQLAAASALLLGRKTYEGLAGVWSGTTGE
jgi:dihydrofolate reductase